MQSLLSGDARVGAALSEVVVLPASGGTVLENLSPTQPPDGLRFEREVRGG